MKAKIPQVLSRDAVKELREITLRRMHLSDVLLDSRIRARLDLNDEQIKKIQEIHEKGGEGVWVTTSLNRPITSQVIGVDFYDAKNSTTFLYGMLVDQSSSASRTELLKDPDAATNRGARKARAQV